MNRFARPTVSSHIATKLFIDGGAATMPVQDRSPEIHSTNAIPPNRDRGFHYMALSTPPPASAFLVGAAHVNQPARP